VQAVAVVDDGATAVSQVGRVITWNVGIIGARAVLKQNYYAYNNRSYAVQEIWDIPECHVYVNGVEVDGGLFFYIDWTPSHYNLVQCTRLFGSTGDFQLCPIPAPPDDYWLPLPELNPE
jgi:hypothetical protein